MPSGRRYAASHTQTRSPTRERGAVADRVHRAGAVLVRHLLPVRIRAGPALPVRRVHAGHGDPYPHLTWTGFRHRPVVDEPEHLGAARGAVDDRAHGSSLLRRCWVGADGTRNRRPADLASWHTRHVVVRLIVAVNPTAGAGLAPRLADEVTARLTAAGHEVTRAEAADGEALERHLRSRVARESPDVVIAVGGDGMVHLVVNAIARSGAVLGILPAGTGNDIARCLEPAVRRPRGGDRPHRERPRGGGAAHPPGGRRAHEHRPVVRRHALRGLRRGGERAGEPHAVAHAAAPATCSPCCSSSPASRRTATGSRSTATRGRSTPVLVTVGNTTSIGGGMRLTPDAKMDDGLLDVLVATPLPRRQLIRLLPKVFTGAHVHDEHVSIERGRVVTIDVADRRAPVPVVYADGERMGALPVTLEIVPAALRVLT